ncbi:gtpase activating protein-related [Schistosoma mansoni]|nr:gtpase activating protein-related [Schistosoma mansoni]|eukprot:XP_018652109.1 gtpase activating protein-related [Schistosoma mansoni]
MYLSPAFYHFHDFVKASLSLLVIDSENDLLFSIFGEYRLMNEMSLGRSSREVVYIKAKLSTESGTDQYKKFAIDPNITDYKVLLGLLRKCFDINCDFSVCYLAIDEFGEQFYLPLQSDWDLDASIVTSSDSTLRLKITLKPKVSDLQDWDIIIPSGVQSISRRRKSQNDTKNDLTFNDFKGPSLFSQITQRFEKTVANVRKAIGIVMDGDDMFHTIHPPISDTQMRLYMDDNGRIIYLNQFYLDVYLNGLEHSLRKVGWRILLSVCPADTTGQERFHLLDIKAQQYATLKENWKKLYVMGLMSEHQLSTLASISIDVVRTDWKEDYYRSVGNHHRVCQLFDILATYCIHHPNIGYCQGMSDLASPLLVVQSDEALAYLSFCALMQRVKFKFGDTQQSILINNMQDLHDLLTYTDSELAQFFRAHNLANMYFTQRWFVLELKREFNFDESLRMFESQWAALCLVKNNSLIEIETCNSKSEGYLVLTDGTSNLYMPNTSFTSTNSLNWHHYTARDVSLINSLIGSNYVVDLKKKGFTTVSNPDTIKKDHPSSSPSPFITSDAHFSCELSNQDFNSGNPQQTSSETLITETQFEIISNESLLDFTNSIKNQSLHLTSTKRLSSFSIENEPIHIKTNVTHLPPPNQFGQGNPFLLFLSLSLILEYKEVIMLEIKEPGDIIQFYQQQSGKHNSSRILYRAKKLFNKYLEENNFQFFS